MRPSVPRLLTIVPRSEIPKPHLRCIKPPPARLSERQTTPTLIEHLRKRQKERTRLYTEARAKQKIEGGDIDVQPWPKNLRIEPIVNREALSAISKDVRMRVKEAFKER